MKVLFQTVGLGGKGSPVWSALKFTVDQVKPDLLVQICSKRTYDETVPLFNQLYKEVGSTTPKTNYHVLANEHDFEEIRTGLISKVRELEVRYPGLTIEGDYTSGTKVMSSAIMSSLLECNASYLHYAIGKHDDLTQTIVNEELLTFSSAEIFAERMLPEFGRLFDKHQFLSINDQIDSLLPSLDNSSLKSRLERVKIICKCCDSWNRFDWKTACTIFSQHVKGQLDAYKEDGWNVKRLNANYKHLQSCVGKKYGFHRCVDLLENARVRILLGFYDDALSRLYRLIELIAQVRMQHHRHAGDGNPTKNVPIAWFEKNVPKMYKELRPNSRYDKVSLGLDDAIAVLNELNDELGSIIEKDLWRCRGKGKKGKGELRNLLDNRNDSFLAHGDVPAKRDKAEELLKYAEKYLKTLDSFAEQQFAATKPAFPAHLGDK